MSLRSFLVPIALMAIMATAMPRAQVPTPAPAPSSTPAAAKPSDAKPDDATNIIFVPYDKMTGPRLGKDQSVLVPYAEFLKLRQGAPGEAAAAPHAIASLSQARLTGTVQGDVARLEAELTIEVLARAEDSLDVQLPFDGAAIESVAVEGANATPGPLENEAGLGLRLKGEGRRTVRLRLAAPIKSEGAVRQLDFGVPRAAASSLVLHVGEDVVLEPVAGDLQRSTLAAAAAGGVDITTIAGEGSRMRLAWKPRVTASGAAAQTRLAAAEQLSLQISRASVQEEINLNLSFLAGRASAVDIDLPQGMRLLSVAGSFVRDWSMPDAAGRVHVTLVRELDEKFDLRLMTQLGASAPASPAGAPAGAAPVAATTTAPIAISGVRVGGAVQESGDVTVQSDADLALWTTETTGLEPVSTGANAGGAASARRYHFAQPGWRLGLTRQTVPARIRASGIVLYEGTDTMIRIKTHHDITVSGRGIYSIAALIPAGFELRQAGPQELVAGSQQNGRRVEINLKNEQSGTFPLELTLQSTRTLEGTRLALAPIAIEGADEDSGYLVLAMPVALRATEIESPGLEATDVRQLIPRLQPLAAPELAATLGYRYFTPNSSAIALIERQRPRLSCETSELATISPALMRIDATLHYTVEFSATDVLQVLLPASVGDEVRFSGADIKEKTRNPATSGTAARATPASGAAPTSSDIALTTWTIRLQRRVLGPYALGISFDIPLSVAASAPAAATGNGANATGAAGATNTGSPNSAQAAPTHATVPTVHAAGVARETGYIGVARGDNLDVSAIKNDGLEARDVKELPAGMGGAYLAYRYYEPKGLHLELALVRHDVEKVLGALIRRMHIETVVSDQRKAVHEIIMEVQNNSEQYLELQLAPDMEIWSAFVGGAAVRTTKGDKPGVQLVELTKSATMDAAFRVRLIVRQTLGASDKMGMFGRLDFAPPLPLNIPVLRATWKLYLPREYQYIGFGGSMNYEAGGVTPWIIPAAEKLLNDVPADLAGGVAQQTLRPPVAHVGADYDATETDAEKQARLQGTALDIPIVRDGKQYEFSKLSGVGDIRVSYWKPRPLLLLQGFVGLMIFLWLMLKMSGGRRLGFGLTVAIALFIMTSLLSPGLWERLFGTAFLAAGGALLLRFAMLELTRLRQAMRERQRERELELERERERWRNMPPPPPPTPPDAPPPSPITPPGMGPIPSAPSEG